MHTSAGKRARSRVVMVATENDALKGAKVGGIGDVIRDLPGELGPLGWETTVIVPSYGFLHSVNPSEKIADVTFPFAGREEYCELWRVNLKGGGPSHRPASSRGAEQLILHHPAIGGDPIYYDDPKENVFARDATKFALFCSAAGQYLRAMESPYVLHLHDWHTGYIFLLSELHGAFAHLRPVRKIFTIHNIGYQGTRPMRKYAPSVEDWFPELFRKTRWIREWEDPRYKVPTFTPMLAGIRHASVVTTVSPTYAREITGPGDHANAVYGGEGLENALRAARDESRLFGILNGVEYPPNAGRDAVDDRRLIETVTGEIALDKNGGVAPFRDEIPERLARVLDGKGKFLLSSITRITEQKVRLMFEKGSDGLTALESILELLLRSNAAYIFIGSGSDGYEESLKRAFLRYEPFIFLNGFYQHSAAALFRRGNLFVMPSSYEPCGITQMQAMREGQPCLVHAVGGLKDTVSDGVNGFTFSGATLREKVDNFVRGARRALDIHAKEPARWRDIVASAREARFGWEESARAYASLYEGREPDKR
ncbi:MAG TPA: glycogen/starch synthase [Bacteroidota bacterium]|nr:glycogen/starch synthase [Bacteroidota bacterium]